MRVKFRWMLIPALGVGLAFGTAWGLDPAGPATHLDPGRGPGTRLMRMMDDPGMAEQLGLSEEQASRLQALALDAAKADVRTRSELMLKRLELEELLRADEPDRAAVEQKLGELSDAQHARMKQRINHRLAVQALLTPEQRAKMRKLRRLRRRHRRGFRRQRWEGRPPMREPRGQGLGFGPGSGSGPDFAPESPPHP